MGINDFNRAMAEIGTLYMLIGEVQWRMFGQANLQDLNVSIGNKTLDTAKLTLQNAESLLIEHSTDAHADYSLVFADLALMREALLELLGTMPAPPPA